MSKSLALTAAEYFGLHREPRTSVPIGDGKVAIIAERKGRKVLAIYNQWTSGTYTLLTERQRADLIAALGEKQA